jgi:hypothetical protein
VSHAESKASGDLPPSQSSCLDDGGDGQKALSGDGTVVSGDVVGTASNKINEVRGEVRDEVRGKVRCEVLDEVDPDEEMKKDEISKTIAKYNILRESIASNPSAILLSKSKETTPIKPTSRGQPSESKIDFMSPTPGGNGFAGTEIEKFFKLGNLIANSASLSSSVSVLVDQQISPVHSSNSPPLNPSQQTRPVYQQWFAEYDKQSQGYSSPAAFSAENYKSQQKYYQTQHQHHHQYKYQQQVLRSSMKSPSALFDGAGSSGGHGDSKRVAFSPHNSWDDSGAGWSPMKSSVLASARAITTTSNTTSNSTYTSGPIKKTDPVSFYFYLGSVYAGSAHARTINGGGATAKTFSTRVHNNYASQQHDDE